MFGRIAFDWSGTLSDDAWPVYIANSKILAQFGVEPPAFEQWKARTTQTPIEFFNSYGIMAEPIELFNLYVQYYKEGLENGIRPRPFEDSAHILKFLKSKGTEIAIISSHPLPFIVREAVDYGLHRYISMVDGSLKPNEKEQALKDSHAELYVGDTIYDIRAARAVGIPCIAVTRGYHTADALSKERPDYMFDSLKELKRLLNIYDLKEMLERSS